MPHLTKDLDQALGGLKELDSVDAIGGDGDVGVVAGSGLEVGGHCVWLWRDDEDGGVMEKKEMSNGEKIKLKI